MTMSCGGAEKSPADPTIEVGCGSLLLPPTVTPSSATLHPGDTLRLFAAYTTCSRLPKPVAMQWRSSNSSVATADSGGLVRAFSRGQVTIIATLAADATVNGAGVIVVE
jgi:uncharacterized protein YjdB